MYNGQRSKSFKLCHRSFGVMGSLLCISDLDGSSRMTLLTMMVSSLSILYQLVNDSWSYFPSVRSIFLDVSLPFTEPPILAPEPTFCLARSSWHKSVR